ncbi:MAG: diguanylate cyclase [bacterium]|nr:diguanylate cyclase [bacterium]
MEKILIVEDSNFFGSILKSRLEHNNGYEVMWARSLSETARILEDPNNIFLAGILDFNLPDAMDGEIIDVVVRKRIPVIVFTGNANEETRNLVWSKDVVDYVLKEDSQSIDYILSMLNRLKKNADIKIIAVAESDSFRIIIKNLLNIHQYKVFTANDGKKALELLSTYPDTKLVIAEYSMPGMDGFDLTKKIRENYKREDLAIIGILSEKEKVSAARFLKNGANDFIIKESFLTEEFYSRITQNIENIERINTIKEASIKDFLTGLYNRRYFFESGKKFFANAVRGHLNIICAMVDIDYFKKVNDTYGHEVGDIALRHVSSILNNRMRKSDIVTRFGGEEFCILAINMKAEKIKEIFKELCKKVESSPVELADKKNIKITISIGVSSKLTDNLEGMVKEADELLYKAKTAGRNRVEID